MIDIKSLTKKDIGRWVVYKRKYGKTHHHPQTKKFGRLKSWNNLFIFVVYQCADNWQDFMIYTGCATYPKYLEFYTDQEIDK